MLSVSLSVRPWVRGSVGPWVHGSVGPSVRNSLMKNAITAKIQVNATKFKKIQQNSQLDALLFAPNLFPHSFPSSLHPLSPRSSWSMKEGKPKPNYSHKHITYKRITLQLHVNMTYLNLSMFLQEFM